MTIRKFLDLSTAHITEGTNNWLSWQTSPDIADYPHVHDLRDGWFIWADPEPRPEQNVPKELRAIMAHARAND